VVGALLGRKIGMTQVYNEAGILKPVTVLEVGPCTVLQVKTTATDGYSAVQLGFADKLRRKASKPESGHVRKVNAEPKRFIREVRLEKDPVGVNPGDVLTVTEFEGIKEVDVVGTSKGKGFQGVVRRHHFAGLGASHGVSKVHRRPGSAGASAFPSRSIKGLRLPGQMGNARATQKNVEIVKLDAANNLLLVKGGVPGANSGFVYVRTAKSLTRSTGKKS
jgi:large subunit ribosomal protein L3